MRAQLEPWDDIIPQGSCRFSVWLVAVDARIEQFLADISHLIVASPVSNDGRQEQLSCIDLRESDSRLVQPVGVPQPYIVERNFKIGALGSCALHEG